MKTIKFQIKLPDFEDENLVGKYEIKELTAKEMLDFARKYREEHNIKPGVEIDPEVWNTELIIECSSKNGEKLSKEFIDNSPTRLYQALLVCVSKLNALEQEEESFLFRRS